MAGELTLGRRERSALGALVAEAERETGLQIVLYVGPAEGDPGARADELLARTGDTVPAVLLLVALDARRVEVRTDPLSRARVPDEAAAEAVTALTTRLADGDLTGGVTAALQVLRTAAGPGASTGPELPDVLGP